MNSYTTEEIVCEICGSNDSIVLFEDKQLSLSGKKGIVKCTNCGLVYRNIRILPSSILKKYENKSYQDQSKDWEEGIKDHYKPYIELLNSFREQNRILDIGAGPGFFLAMCQDKGWECYGIEPSIECCSFAADHFRIHLSNAVLEEGQYENGFFDIVTFWGVLEVLSNPKKTLSLVHKVLRPGGAVLIRSVNASFHIPVKKAFRTVKKIFPKLSTLDHSVFHLYSFDKQTLTQLLSMTHYEDIRVTPAKLTWTTTHSARSGISKKIVTTAIDSISRILYVLPPKKLISPSLLALALKPMTHEKDLPPAFIL